MRCTGDFYIVNEIHVVCLVLVDASGYFYATQRPENKRMAFHWEFPGGKVESGENPECALRREIEEELTWSVGDLERLPDSVHSYELGTIRLTPFFHRCLVRPDFFLTEHVDSRWMHASDWDGYTWTPADVPIVEQLLKEIVSYE